MLFILEAWGEVTYLSGLILLRATWETETIQVPHQVNGARTVDLPIKSLPNELAHVRRLSVLELHTLAIPSTMVGSLFQHKPIHTVGMSPFI